MLTHFFRAILGQMVSKVLDHGCRIMILIAPGWQNIPFFMDLVKMSVQIPLSLPGLENLLTEPFNDFPHKNLQNLNLHAWLLEPKPFKNKIL